MKRRTLLSAGLALGGSFLLPRARAAGGKVVIVGGGWGGLATARHLREVAPALDVVLIERNDHFWSRPLSNRWLFGLIDGATLRFNYSATARGWGYRYLQGEIDSIDRQRQVVQLGDQALHYDWLVIAAGIREDFSAWYGDDRTAAAHTREHFPSAFADRDGHTRLKALLDQFRGGDLVMTIPPAPYRCPPAPYERAGMIAWWMKRNKINGRLIILDPNLPSLGFERVFEEAYRDQVTYLPQARIADIDPFRRRIVTDFDTIDFSSAILMPPQQAADLVWQAGLIGADREGKPSGWAEHDPVTMNVVGDERVFVIGDLLGKTSPLFGYYPKTGQMAARQGEIVAMEIAAQAGYGAQPKQLPDSTCHVLMRLEPQEISTVQTSYSFRGDGVIRQLARQSYNPQASDEDVAWAKAMFDELGLKKG